MRANSILETIGNMARGASAAIGNAASGRMQTPTGIS